MPIYKLMTVLTLILLSTLFGCSKKKLDYSLPHEYIEIKGYHRDGGDSIKNKSISYFGLGLIEDKRNYFEVGSRGCTQYLNEISDQEVRINMRAYNSFLLNKGRVGDKPVVRATLGCIRTKGLNKRCESDIKELAGNLLPSRLGFKLQADAKTICTPTERIGELREVWLHQS